MVKPTREIGETVLVRLTPAAVLEGSQGAWLGSVGLSWVLWAVPGTARGLSGPFWRACGAPGQAFCKCTGVAGFRHGPVHLFWVCFLGPFRALSAIPAGLGSFLCRDPRLGLDSEFCINILHPDAHVCTRKGMCPHNVGMSSVDLWISLWECV